MEDNTMAKSKTWLITGCSTGLGRNMAKVLLENGENVAVTARNTDTVSDLYKEYPENALILPLDVTVQEEVDKAVEMTR